MAQGEQAQVVANAAFRFRFDENDRVLCYHGNILYEAKCLKRFKVNENNQVKYLLHYVGWNSRWDEWVDDDQIVALNCVSMKKMASLKAMHSTSKKAKEKHSIASVKPYSSSSSLKQKKIKQKRCSKI